MHISNTKDEVRNLSETLKLQIQKMKNHRVFESIQTMDDLRVFMSWHVFAVWDFMTLAKRLQLEYTCMQLPWRPTRSKMAARLVNEIILGEETDLTPVEDEYASHLHLYLLAMKEVSADTRQIEHFLQLLENNIAFEEALRIAKVPDAVITFVESTVRLGVRGSLGEVLGSFFYGREDSIPGMFQRLLDTWGLTEKDAPVFVFYLKRHIELDSGSHGPAAQALMNEEVGNDNAARAKLLTAAINAVNQRILLWDALADVINSPTSYTSDSKASDSTYTTFIEQENGRLKELLNQRELELKTLKNRTSALV
jgi:mannose/fructose/N-acetylgalactosamine-specific phosphotransferase system component IIB